MTGAELADIAARLYGQQGQAGADAANRQGQILGGTLAGIGNLIGQIPAQQREQQAQQMAIQTQGLHNQVLQGQIHSQQSAEASQQKADAAVAELARNDDGTVDLAGLHQVLTKNGVSLADQAKAISDAKIVNDSLSAGRKSRIEDRSNFAEAALSTLPKDQPIDVPSFQHMMALGRGTNLTDTDIKQANDELTNGADARQLLTQWRNSGTKYNVPPKFGKLGPGEVPFNEATGATTGAEPLPSEKKTQAELASDAANPKSPTQAQSQTALDLLQKPPKEANAQHVPFMLDGKQVQGSFVPTPEGGKYLYNGQDVSGRAKPIPPASVQVQNITAWQQLPAFAMDASRPSGAEANIADRTTGLSPNGLYQSTLAYLETGQFPPIGRGQSPRAQAVQSAIQNKAGALAADAGMDLPAFRATYSANKASLAQQQKAADSVQAFMATADKNVEKLEEALKKIPDTGIPLFNQPLRSFATKVQGDPNLSQFATYLQSVKNEYSRIISQPNLSGQLTDSARREGSALVKDEATVPQMLASIQALKTEGTNRLVSIGDQIKRIQGRMTGPGGGPSSGQTAAAPASTVPSNVAAALKGQGAGRHTLSDGSVWDVGSDGSVRKAP